MRRRRALISVALALVALALILAACGGGDDRESTTRPAPAETPSGGAAPPSTGALPPAVVKCMADRGIDLESSPDLIHSPEGDACFDSLHQGGGVP